MKPVMLISRVFPPAVGGSGRWLWELYRRLPSADVVVAAGRHASDAAFDATHDVRVTRVDLALSTLGFFSPSGMRQYAKAYCSLARMVRKFRPQQVHCGALLPDGWLAWLLRARFGIPYVCYIHGEEACYADASRELDWMARRVLRGAQFVIANSRNTVNVLGARWNVDERRIRLLHPGFDSKVFTPGADATVRASLGWMDRRVVLTAGRLQRRKGQDTMIRAIDEVRRRVPSVLYAIAGDGADREYLNELVSELRLDGHVQFLGELSDRELIDCYRNCDLFVLPNRQIGRDIEGFGMVLLEAQACGKPVIAGNSGGTAETMAAGESGLAINCAEPTELARHVTDLLQDDARRERMGRAGREWVTRNFDWEILVARASELFGIEARSAQSAVSECDSTAESVATNETLAAG